MARTVHQWDCGEALTQRLQWHIHASTRQGMDCSLLIFRPLEQTPPSGKACPERVRIALRTLADRIRPYIRRTDTIETEDDNAVAIVLHGAGPEGAHAAFKRLHELLPTPLDPTASTCAITLGYATNTTGNGDECSISGTIADAGKPRVLLSVALALPRENHPLLASESIPEASRAEGHNTADARRPVASASRAPRRSHLRLVAFDSLAQPVNEDLRARARSLGVPFVQLPARLPTSCRGAIAPELAHELHAVPIGRSRSMLTVAMHDPSDASAVLRLRSATGLSIFPVLAASDELERALRQIARAGVGSASQQ